MRKGLPRLTLVAALALACQRNADPDAAPSPQTGGPDPTSPPSAQTSKGFVPLRMLTVEQIRNATADLLGPVELNLPNGLYTGLQAARGSVNPLLAEELENAFLGVTAATFAKPEWRSALTRCDGVQNWCRQAYLTAFMRRAWRRPATADEIARYVGVANLGSDLLGDPWQGLGLAVAGVLQSPNFLYLTNLGPEAGASNASLELGARLAFFLWNSLPDEELLATAESGALVQPEVAAAQVRRMLGSPRARTGILQFFSDLFDLHHLDEMQKDPNFFPSFNRALATSMREEMRLNLERFLLEGGGDFRQLFTRKETFVNDALAAHYGLPVLGGAEGAKFRPAVWPADQPRAGLLGFAGLLTLRSTGLGTSPTLRGNYVRAVLLCQIVPPPPDDATAVLPAQTGQPRTMRELLGEHVRNSSCAACHNLMDPIGLALQHFDAVGAYRATENNHPIDASGTLDGVAFADAAGLGQALGNHEALVPCLVRQLMRQVSGRFESGDEYALSARFAERFTAANFSVPALVQAMTESPWFMKGGY